MTDQKYTGIGSRIVFDAQTTSGYVKQEDIFRLDSESENPELQVELRYFIVDLKPSSIKHSKERDEQETSVKQSKDKDEQEASEALNKNCLNNGDKKDLDGSISLTDTISCDSFYSCKSSTSINKLSSKKESEGSRKYLLDKGNNIIINNKDFLSQLTMVNAIFLNNSAGEWTHSEKSKRTQGEDCLHNDELKTLYSPTASNTFCPEAFTCQIDRNVEVKYINRICGDNSTTKPFINTHRVTYTIPEDENLHSQESWRAKINMSKSYEPELKKKGFSVFDRRMKSRKNNENKNVHKKLPLSTFVLKQKKHVYSGPFMYKKVEVKIPKKRFAELIPICDESSIPVILEGKKCTHKFEKRMEEVKEERSKQGEQQGYDATFSKQGEQQGYDATFSKPGHLNISSMTAPLEGQESTFNIGKYFCGEGECANEVEPLLNSSLKQIKELFIKNIDESYLRTLISQSLQKIQNESKNNGKVNNLSCCKSEPINCFIWNSQEETNIFNKQDGCKVMNKIGSEISNLVVKQDEIKRTLSNTDIDLYRNMKRDDKIKKEVMNSTFNNRPSSGQLNIINQNVKYRNTECNSVINKENCCVKRRPLERKNLLPVIEEESFESLISDSSEENAAADYYLVDSSGRAIHLFDVKGLPLTDGCGRPLRSAHGKLLMECDKNGIPVAGIDSYNIFDMFGRQPHEDKFDPAMAPKMPVSSKLSTSGGKPLLLYDVEGRPLTSISGTMLVDSSGRGLVRLTCVDGSV